MGASLTALNAELVVWFISLKQAPNALDKHQFNRVEYGPKGPRAKKHIR